MASSFGANATPIHPYTLWCSSKWCSECLCWDHIDWGSNNQIISQDHVQKPININVALGEVFEEYLLGTFFLVKLSAYSLLLDWERSAFGGVFKDFTSILVAPFLLFFQNSSWVAASIVCFLYLPLFLKL